MGALGHAALAGQVLGGQYRVEHVLGEGGYGIVYAATDLTIGHRVALKILHAAWDSGHAGRSALARFVREAELVRRLVHPNTVRVVGFGELSPGSPYIAYELLEGAALDRVLARRGPMPPARARWIARQILAALAEAHGLGIVHRDIKPANVFLCTTSGQGDVVKLLDFGVAAARFDHDGRSLTQEGMTIGTPAYMAPEQVFGSHVDARTDLYAVGLVIAEMLTGYPVFQRGTSMQIAMEQASARPVPLAREVLASELGDVVRIATEKDASRRYVSAFEMMRELDRAPMERAPGASYAPGAFSATSRSADAFAATSAIASVDPAAARMTATPDTSQALAPTAVSPVMPRTTSRRGLVLGLVGATAAAASASAGTWWWMHDAGGKRGRGTAEDTAEESDERGDTWESDEIDESLRPMAEHWEREAKRYEGLTIAPFEALPDDEADDAFDLDAFTIDGTTGTQIVARMTGKGWKQTAMNTMGGAAIRTFAYRHPAFRTTAHLSLSSVGMPSQLGITRRAGNYTLTVVVNDRFGHEDEPAAKRLLDDLLRK